MFDDLRFGKPLYNLKINIKISEAEVVNVIKGMNDGILAVQLERINNIYQIAHRLFDMPLHVRRKLTKQDDTTIDEVAYRFLRPENISGLDNIAAELDLNENIAALLQIDNILKTRKPYTQEHVPMGGHPVDTPANSNLHYVSNPIDIPALIHIHYVRDKSHPSDALVTDIDKIVAHKGKLILI